MTNEDTNAKMTEMRLTAMVHAFRGQLKDPSFANLSFEERISLLVDIEWSSRKSNRLKKLIKNTQFDQPQAHVADINYAVERKLNREQCKRQSKVQNFRQDKYKEFGNQNAEFSAMEVQRFRQRVCLLEL